MLCCPIASSRSWVRAVSWYAPRHQGQIVRNLLEWTCGSLGIGLHESSTALQHRSTLNLSLLVHIAWAESWLTLIFAAL
jgi:hypothetical protein